MKRSIYLVIASIILASCGGEGGDKQAKLASLKKQRSEIDLQIRTLEAEVGKANPAKAAPVSAMVLQAQPFSAYIEVQAQITGDENVNATPQSPGTVRNIRVRVGQQVRAGQILATLDASTLDQQIASLTPNIELAKSLYDKQQRLWAQNVGTEVQLLQAKTNYESLLKQRSVLNAQREMYAIKAPISGVVDAVNIKEGDMAAPGAPTGIRIVSKDKLKAEAQLGENYLGQVDKGDPVTLVFPDINDSIGARISYVSQAIDPLSRSFMVQVNLGGNKKLHPNMSARMKISSYENNNALAVPVSLIQKTAEGEMVYVIENNKAKAVIVETGRTSNGMVEILSGLEPGAKVITAGYSELIDGQTVAVK